MDTNRAVGDQAVPGVGEGAQGEALSDDRPRASRAPAFPGAADRPWNSATTLFFARRLHDIAAGRPLSVLDMGCGEGTVLEQLIEYGYDLYGYDLSYREDLREARLKKYFGASYPERIKTAPDERTIPFADNSFDVVFSNQVFEHVKFFDRMLAECARVLRPGGVLLAMFPLATYPLEGHTKIPFVHWLPPGPLRVRYLKAVNLFTHKGRRAQAFKHAAWQDRWLAENTFYRFMNEVLHVGSEYFESCEIETDRFWEAKLDLMTHSTSRLKRMVGAGAGRINRSWMAGLLTHGYNAAFCWRDPKKEVLARD